MRAEENDLHLHTIIHPKLTEKENGKRNPPTPYDLKGGSEWFNSGKCMVTIHRSDLSSNVCEFYANKIKPRSNGKIGWTTLYFDLSRFVYYNEEIVNNVRITKYASPKDEKNEVVNEIKQLTPNFDFDTKDMNEWNDAK
jgi:hypothetical protein